MANILKENARELFSSIDCIKNSDKQNFNIMIRVKEKLQYKLICFFNRRDKKKEKQKIVEDYIIFLTDFNEIIYDQIALINDYYKNNDESDISLILKSGKDLYGHFIKNFVLKIFNFSDVFSEEERKMYITVKLHEIISEFNNVSKNSSKNSEDAKGENDLLLPNWQKYFYMLLEEEQNKKVEKEILEDYLDEEESDEFYIKKSDFYIKEFQYLLSRNVFYQRKKKNLTQLQLSKRSGVDRTMIAKIERLGKNTTVETAMKLLSALDSRLYINREEVG